MKVVIKLKSGVEDGNRTRELIAVYIDKDGVQRNKRYFPNLDSAYYVAKKESIRNNCIIVGYM